jgi:hypothetical protein
MWLLMRVDGMIACQPAVYKLDSELPDTPTTSYPKKKLTNPKDHPSDGSG